MRTISKRGITLKQSILSKIEKNEIGKIQEKLGTKRINQSASQTDEVDWDLINNLEHNKELDEM